MKKAFVPTFFKVFIDHQFLITLSLEKETVVLEKSLDFWIQKTSYEPWF